MKKPVRPSCAHSPALQGACPTKINTQWRDAADRATTILRDVLDLSTKDITVNEKMTSNRQSRRWCFSRPSRYGSGFARRGGQ
jgi:hypothetical protein